MVRGGRPFTGEGTNESHSSSVRVLLMLSFSVTCGAWCRPVWAIKLLLFNIRLLLCSRFLLHPCRRLLWKMILSFPPTAGMCIKHCGKWTLESAAVLCCSGNSKQALLKEGSAQETQLYCLTESCRDFFRLWSCQMSSESVLKEKPLWYCTETKVEAVPTVDWCLWLSKIPFEQERGGRKL